MAVLCRYPDAFGAAIGMSGTYRIDRFYDEAWSQDLFYSAPLQFVPGLQGPQLDRLRQRFALLACGAGDWEDPGESWRMAEVLVRLGAEHVLVFHGEDGMDELTIAGPSQVIEVRGGALEEYTVDPLELGFRRAALEAMRGGGPAENAAIAREVLGGADGPRRDIVLLNAAAALKAAGLAQDFREGIGLAVHALDSGAAAAKLDAWVAASKRAASVPA